MRIWLASCAAALLSLGPVAPAAAVPTAFSGTPTVVISMPDASLLPGSGVYAPLPPIEISATGTADVSLSGGTITGFSLAGGTFATTVTIPVTDAATAPLTELVT